MYRFRLVHTHKKVPNESIDSFSPVWACERVFGTPVLLNRREAFFNFLVGPMFHDLDTYQLSEKLLMEFSAYFSLKLGVWGPF